MTAKNFLLAILIFSGNVGLFSQNINEPNPSGMPGDHFSLEGALEVFMKSQNPEEFEKNLNDKDNHINNLDLNGDGETDYVRVISKQDKDVHILVMQVPVSETENQDIGVIQIEKTSNEEAHIQIIGDEDIFGEEIIIEPSDESYDAKNNDQKEQSLSDPEDKIVVVNVWTWPSVRYIYSPVYRPWISPWRWSYYPVWYKPWRPLTWNTWRPLKIRYYKPTIRVVHTHRLTRANGLYKPVRVSSTTVKTKYSGAHANYKVTRTKTKVTGPKGKTVTKKTTKVKGPKGNTKAKKTTVKKSRKGNN